MPLQYFGRANVDEIKVNREVLDLFLQYMPDTAQCRCDFKPDNVIDLGSRGLDLKVRATQARFKLARQWRRLQVSCEDSWIV